MIQVIPPQGRGHNRHGQSCLDIRLYLWLTSKQCILGVLQNVSVTNPTFPDHSYGARELDKTGDKIPCKGAGQKWKEQKLRFLGNLAEQEAKTPS